MSGFRVSNKVKKYHQMSVQQVQDYKNAIYSFIEQNSTKSMNVTSIARKIVHDPKDKAEVERVGRLIRNMRDQGLVSMSGGAQNGYWSIVREVGRIKPTYKKPTTELPKYLEEALEEEAAMRVIEEAKTKQVEEPQPVVQEQTPAPEQAAPVSVPVQSTPKYFDIKRPQQRAPQQQMQVQRAPRRLTITIDL